MGGAEVGAQLIQMLKRAGNVDFVVSIVSIVIYCSISSFHGVGELQDSPLANRRRGPLRQNRGKTSPPLVTLPMQSIAFRFGRWSRSRPRA